jgi:dual specificity protein kinase YAK1
MDPQWQTYNDAAGSARRHNGAAQSPRDYRTQQQQQQPPSSSSSSQAGPGYKYDQYGAASGQVTPGSASGGVAPQLRDGNGDIPMHDAHDAHGGIKYPMRPHHQTQLSGSRTATLQPANESSTAAQRYSPMEAMSPTSPYAPKSSQFANPASQRQSPTRQNDYAQLPYYGGRQHLPPISPFASTNDGYPSSAVAALDNAFAHDPKSPVRPNPVAIKPVPEFRKIRALSELQPKNSRQPPFRRANPEGGFISVSKTAHCASRLHLHIALPHGVQGQL